MALKGLMSRAVLTASFLALDISLLLYINIPVTQGSLHARRLAPADYSGAIQASDAGVLRRVNLEGISVFTVVQQPSGKPNYVSKELGKVTQFSPASQYGNIGLLAHNYLSGASFFRITMGQEIDLEYSDGTTESFVVTEILRYQALEPKSPFSSFRNLTDSDEILSTSQMVERAYGGDRRVTFQTCIARFGVPSWGRLFVVATPKDEFLGMAP